MEKKGKKNSNSSFGLGSDHIREKDGIFAILCWLSIIACNYLLKLDHNKDTTKPLISVEEIVHNHWTEFGRYVYSRYDFENVTSEQGDKMMQNLMDLSKSTPKGGIYLSN